MKPLYIIALILLSPLSVVFQKNKKIMNSSALAGVPQKITRHGWCFLPPVVHSVPKNKKT